MRDTKTKKKSNVADAPLPIPDDETFAYWKSFGGKIAAFHWHYFYKRVLPSSNDGGRSDG